MREGDSARQNADAATEAHTLGAIRLDLPSRHAVDRGDGAPLLSTLLFEREGTAARCGLQPTKAPALTHQRIARASLRRPAMPGR